MTSEEKINRPAQKLSSLLPPISQKEILEGYNDIELTDDEMTEAIILAKKKKAEEIRIQKLREYEAENQRIRNMKWNFDIMRTFMVNRADKIFKDKFTLDDHNHDLFDLMCYYFLEDEEQFLKQATLMRIDNPSIKKGFLIPGEFGVGKTWMMKLFSRNARQSFDIVRAKTISDEFLRSEKKIIPEKYFRLLRNNWDEQREPSDTNYPNDEVFNQKVLGLCIDDLGSEDVKNNFGNKVNVIGDVLEGRYASGYTGLFLHATTNMNATNLKDFYGGRNTSRMREIFNVVELGGDDRRK